MRRNYPTNKYYEDKEHTKNAVKYMVDFINSNLKYLNRDNQLKFKSLEMNFKLEGELTPNQYSFMEGLYEKTWKGAGAPSCDTKHDLKKGLRY